MGKMKRKSKLSGRGDSFRSSETLTSSMAREKYGKVPRVRHEIVEDESGTTIVDQGLTIKILREAKKQREELEESLVEEEQQQPTTSSTRRDRLNVGPSFNEDDFPSLEAAGEDEYSYEEDGITELEIDAEDEAAFDKFMPKGLEKMRNLADIIQEKLTERQTELSQMSDNESLQMQKLDPRLVDIFAGVAEVLSKYRSGKLPKPFKIIPKMANWEQVLFLTEPDKWTAASMLQATRLFASNLNERMAQRFYNLILLPRLRDDIAQYKKLNFHLYQALKKALFKPGAFFKGILLPLCENGCTLRECTVIGSVLMTCSVPMLHAAAAMLKIAEMEYSGASSMFLRVLIAKRFALPYRCIDGLVHHFLRFSMDNRVLPVLWHQALQALAENYGEDISQEQKDSLLELTRKHFHHKISPVIRQSLMSSGQRDQKKDEKMDDDIRSDNPDME